MHKALRLPIGVFATVSAVLAATAPTHATGTIVCEGVNDPGVTAFVSVGRVPVLAVLRAEFTALGMVWSTFSEDATPIIFGQGVDLADGLRIDFTNEDISEIVVTLRTVRAFEGKAGGEAGVLQIVGTGAWPVVCEQG